MKNFILLLIALLPLFTQGQAIDKVTGCTYDLLVQPSDYNGHVITSFGISFVEDTMHSEIDRCGRIHFYFSRCDIHVDTLTENVTVDDGRHFIPFDSGMILLYMGTYFVNFSVDYGIVYGKVLRPYSPSLRKSLYQFLLNQKCQLP